MKTNCATVFVVMGAGPLMAGSATAKDLAAVAKKSQATDTGVLCGSTTLLALAVSKTKPVGMPLGGVMVICAPGRMGSGRVSEAVVAPAGMVMVTGVGLA